MKNQTFKINGQSGGITTSSSKMPESKQTAGPAKPLAAPAVKHTATDDDTDMNRFAIILGACCAAAPPLRAETTPPLNDAPAETGTWGYRPIENMPTAVNPPGFVWRPQDGAVGYDLDCSRDEKFLTLICAERDLPDNAHCPARELPAGRWYWRYRAVGPGKRRSAWSRPRMFQITDDAVRFPKPSLRQQRKALPATHPRMFLRPEALPALRASAAGDRQTLFAALRQSADAAMHADVITAEPPPYPTGRRQNTAEDIITWRENRKISSAAVTKASLLAFTYMLTEEARYGHRAVDWMMAVADWPADGTTSYAYNDECAMPILYELARAYSWARPAMSDAQRRRFLNTMRMRGNEVHAHLTRLQHLWKPYNSHSNRAWHFLGEAGVAFYDEIPEAEKWLDYALTVFYCAYPVWSDHDGGWHEGAAYWSSYLNRVTWWMDVMREGLGIEGYRKPFFSRVGDFAMYTIVPNEPIGGFGDSADAMRWPTLCPLMHVFAGQAGNAHWQWYANHVPAPAGGYLGFLRAGRDTPTPVPPVGLPTAKVFNHVGVGHLHTDLTDHRRDVHLAFKSSPMGSQSHGFNSQNSFLLTAFGEALIEWSGHRDWHGSPHHRQWMQETISDNSLLVNGLGQLTRSGTDRGEITAFKHTPHLDLIGGEAGPAYGAALDHWERLILFARPDWVVILDDVIAPEPATFDWLLHTKKALAVTGGRTAGIQGKSAGCEIAFLAPTKIELKVSEGFGDVPPLAYKFKDMHLTAHTTAPARRVQFLTVLRPRESQGAAAVPVEYLELENGDGHACRLRDAGRELVVLWQPKDEGLELTAYGLTSQTRLAARLSLADENIVVELTHGAK